MHRAVDTRLGRTVAIKLLRGGSGSDVIARARMRSEASLAGSIHHPGVAQVYDFGEDMAGAGLTFIVMELVEGRTLAQLLREQGPMPPEQVMSVVKQVAEGLAAAHAAGVVHRDLKPANIMLTPEGRTVLVDFGIARGSDSEPLTETGALVGTAEYMSPEQASGRSATDRSDLYALGVVAYHCLSGTSPFRRETTISTALAHLNDELPPTPPGTPADVQRLISSLVAKNPAERPDSAAVVALEAAQIGAASTIDLPPTFELRVVDTIPLAPQGTPVRRRARLTGRRRPATFASIGVATAAVVLLGVYGLRDGDPAQVPDVVGLTVAEATDRLQDAGLSVETEVIDQAGHPSGQVVRQSPAGGASTDQKGAVALSVASGAVTVSVGDIVGSSFAQAAARLERLGLQVVRRDVDSNTSVGDVMAIDRSGRVPDGSIITVSVGVAPVSPPQETSTSAQLAPSAGGGSSSAAAQGASKDFTSGGGKGAGNVAGAGKGKKK